MHHIQRIIGRIDDSILIRNNGINQWSSERQWLSIYISIPSKNVFHIWMPAKDFSGKKSHPQTDSTKGSSV